MEPGPGPAVAPEPEGAGDAAARPVLAWSAAEVAEWVARLGFPQYEECFRANGVTGRRLVFANCSRLPAMGVTDFGHMQDISRHVRELLGIKEPLFSRSIALPYRDSMGLFLERKSRSGKRADALTFSQFVQEAGLEPYATVPPSQKARTGEETDALPVSLGTRARLRDSRCTFTFVRSEQGEQNRPLLLCPLSGSASLNYRKSLCCSSPCDDYKRSPKMASLCNPLFASRN